MGSFYAVMLSDLRRRADRQVERRTNRKSAERIARELNGESLATGGDRAPLYYVLRKVVKHGRE